VRNPLSAAGADPTASDFASLKDEHRRQKRALIETAAAVVFAQKGFENATVAEVAEAAGITPGTIYLYFGSRHELLFATVLHEIDDLEARMRRVVEEAKPPAVTVQQMMDAYLEFCRERPHGFQMLVAGVTRTARAKTRSELVAEYDRRATGCLALLHDQVARGVEDGVFRAGDTWELTHAIWGACHGILQLAVSGGDPNHFVGFEVKTLFDRTCKALLEGILALSHPRTPSTSPARDKTGQDKT